MLREAPLARRLVPYFFVLLVLAPPSLCQAKFDAGLLAGMRARSIGPAGMSGRIVAIAGVPKDENIIYLGTATGGLWKSVNGGLNFEPVFDDQPVASIGAIALEPGNPDVVWVGTGEANPRNSASVGNGIYKSLDGGRSWQHLGLDRSEHIRRIVIDPRDPDRVYVACLGPAWSDGGDRGLYRTTDGGKSWKKILGANDRTGCTELVMDPSNPNKLFAALWEYRRWPWFFESGGKGSGLFVSYDAGDSWQQLGEEDGLPAGELGRIAMAFSPSNPEIVYALVEAKDNVFLRSGDGGHSFKTTSKGDKIGNRPFYFSDIHVDPIWPNRVYSLWSQVSVSMDSGKSFQVLVSWGKAHPDHHALWIDPQNPRRLILGNDGGVYLSQDRGQSWRFVSNLPLAQYYHIAVDDDQPFHVYGGMQDNGSWRGPNTVWENGGIRNYHWEEVGYGDGFDTRPYPKDSMIGYSMSQEGYLIRWNLHTGERKSIRPAPPSDEKLRFNWNAGFSLDPFDVDTIYLGSQYLHKSSDRGEHWTIISPDLTTNNPDWQKQDESGGLTPDVTGAENFTSIVAIEPSPLEQGVIWVGTDDGRLQLTRDGGEHWESLERHAKGVPDNTWIPCIYASTHEPGTAFVVFEDHRRGNWTPYLFRVEDYGKHWKNLATDEIWGYCLSVVQDPVDPQLLFLGTEFGLYFSLDGGDHWMKWKHGIPTVSVMGLAIQARENALVVGTHGRSAYVIDDIRPLRTMSESLLEEPLHLFAVPDAIQYQVKQAGASRFPGDGEFRGKSRPRGAMITVTLHDEDLPYPDEKVEKAHKQAEQEDDLKADDENAASGEAEAKEPEKLRLTVRNARGERVRHFEKEVKQGVNRINWSLDSDAFEKIPGRKNEEEESEGKGGGPQVMPGSYSITLEYKDAEAKGEVKVVPDPRIQISESDRQEAWSTQERLGHLQETIAEAVKRIHAADKDCSFVLAKIARLKAEAKSKEGAAADANPDSTRWQDLKKQAQDLQKGLKDLEERLRGPLKPKGYIGGEWPARRMDRARWLLGPSWQKPTEAGLRYLQLAEEHTRPVLEDLNHFFEKEVPAFKMAVDASGLTLFPQQSPIELSPEGSGARE
jgi:photosystem II stability/assembly factor-like uncharacterized protein